MIIYHIFKTTEANSELLNVQLNVLANAALLHAAWKKTVTCTGLKWMFLQTTILWESLDKFLTF